MMSAGYRALTEAIALLEEPRAVFELRGDRARRVVNGLVTNTLDGLEKGMGRYAFALTAKGRPIADLRVLPSPGFEAAGGPAGSGGDGGEPESVWIDAPSAARDGLRDLFARTVPPIFAKVTEIDVRRLSLVGPAAGDPRPFAACGVAFDLESDAGDAVEPLRAVTARREAGRNGPAGLLVAREAIEVGGWDLYVPEGWADPVRACVEERVREAGGSTATPADWEIVRVERGLPAFGSEITADNLPQETGQTDRAISFRKGCYTGQEVVARIHYRGHVNRLLRGVRPVGEGADPLAAGEPLEVDGREVGRIVTSVRSPRFGSIGLGYLRREVEPGARVSRVEGGGEAEIVDLPFT